MKPVKSLQETVIIPFLLLGYMESLRRTTFYAFDLKDLGIAFTIASFFAMAVAMVYHHSRKLWARGTSSLAIAVYFLINETNVILLAFIIFYGLLLYLLVRYVLERQSVTELIAVSIFLIGIEIIVSKVDITFLVILHIIFLLLLRSSTYYLRLVSKPGFQPKRGFGSAWVRMTLLTTTVIVIVTMLIPTQGSGLVLTSRPVKWAKTQFLEKIGLFDNGNFSSDFPKNQGDKFHVTWDKLQRFEVEGQVQHSDNMVMSVKAPQAFYWRGESADFYTGSGWENSFEVSLVGNNYTRLPNPYGKVVSVQEMDFSFTIAPDLTSTVVFTANVPAKISLPASAFWVDGGGNYYTEVMASGDRYRVTAYIPEFSEKNLRESKINAGPMLEKYYLQLPQDFPKRVRDKALQITKGLIYPYDKVKAIESYLAENYPYNLEVTLPDKKKDITEYFLFELKRGYCTYHSTAMVVMLRSIGIPARWVKGYTTGTFDFQSGCYVVKEKNAHAWVEVYFGEYGWVPFEPTASFHMPTVQSQKTDLVGEHFPKKTKVENLIGAEKVNTEGISPFCAELIVFIVLCLTTSLVVFVLWLLLRKELKAQRADRVRDYYLDMVYLLEGKGYDWSRYQTPYEFATNISQKLPGIGQDVFLITEAYLREQYGNHNVSESHFQKLRQAWENILAALKED